MIINNGITDATQAVQAMLDKCGTIFLDGGTYLFSKPLIIHSNIELILAADAVMRLADGANCAIIENDTLPSRGKDFNANITIFGRIWDGNN